MNLKHRRITGLFTIIGWGIVSHGTGRSGYGPETNRAADSYIGAASPRSRLAGLGALFEILQEGNNLAFTESAFLHLRTTLIGIIYSQLA